MDRFPQTKTTYGFSLWFITCVSLGLGLAYIEGVSANTIITMAAFMAGAVCVGLLVAWILRTFRK